MLKPFLTLTGICLSLFSFSQNGYNLILTFSDAASYRTSGFNEYYENPEKTILRSLSLSARVGLPMKYGKYEIISGIDLRQKGFYDHSNQEYENSFSGAITFYNLEIPLIFKTHLNYAQTQISLIFGFSYGRQLHVSSHYYDYEYYYGFSSGNNNLPETDYNKNSLDLIIGIELSQKINDKFSLTLTPEFSNSLISYNLNSPEKPRINQFRVHFGIIKHTINR